MKNYNFIQKILHDFTLKGNFFKKTIFEIEKIFFYKKINIINNKHIFITGLPRSGTTVLLNYLYSTELFTSLKYSNMPFITAPNFSNYFKKNKTKTFERFHKDHLNINLDSPEAFDEAFFSMFDEKEIKDELIRYIELILLKEKPKRYLSKNNHNYKRIDLLLSIFPLSCFLITVREPLQQAYSLLLQHINFTKLQKKDDFVRRYMNYLKHNEFGVDHSSWNSPNLYNNFDDINYWLEQWLLFYQNLYLNYKNNKSCKFVIYDKIDQIEKIEEINLFTETKLVKDFKFQVSNKDISLKFDQNLYEQAQKVYFQFINKT